MYRKLNLKKGDIIQEEHLAHIEQGIADATPMVNVTYAELVALRNEGKLIAGQKYRMTDYETTCTWMNTQVAGHPFDLVLTALDNKTLDEKCSAIQSARDKDGYFANSNLPAWDVRYCLDNDTERFVWRNMDWESVTWVDANGKGVIYRLIDEAENDVPYDFKNIMFMRPLTEGALDGENGIETFCYTFSCIQDDLTIEDQSVKEPYNCVNNKFGLYCYDNVFLSFSGANCASNTFGNDCYFNTFGNSCDSNTFGNSCFSNTFGNDCASNTFGANCASNTFGNDCFSNTFGNDCASNTFGNSCFSNTFGNDCFSNTFGNDCFSNTFGDNCFSNTFGDNCDSNTFVNNETASYENLVQYYKFDCVVEREIQVYRGRNYDTYITKDKSGNIVEYTVEDIINK